MESGKKTALTLFFLALMIFLVGLGGLLAKSPAQEEEISDTAVLRVTGKDYDTATGSDFLITASGEKLFLADGATFRVGKSLVSLRNFPFPSVVEVTFAKEPDENGIRRVTKIVQLPE